MLKRFGGWRMGSETLEIARRGFTAWQQGDFDTIEAILDPDVQWLSFEPGEWDCQDRTDLMRTVRDRYDEGFARAPIELLDAGDDVVIVIAKPRETGGDEWPPEVATVIRFADGKVVTMQDYRTKQEALASV